MSSPSDQEVEGLQRDLSLTETKLGDEVEEAMEEGDKGHTFRKRRLSLTNLRQFDSDRDDNSHGKVVKTVERAPPSNTDVEAVQTEQNQDGPSAEKAHSFRKRRLSLTHMRQDDSTGEDDYDSSAKRRRRNSEASVDTIDSNSNNHLKSRTAHATELLSHPPPSAAISSTAVPKLYQQAAPPQQRPSIDSLHDSGSPPKWKKRHTRHVDERSLPFPRDIVGTFSCHGVEPIYDSDYQPDFEDQEDEEHDEWVVGNGNLLGGKRLPDIPEETSEKPTMMAKTNQDRGGVAFPYGNCPKTALFAVYDGAQNQFPCFTT